MFRMEWHVTFVCCSIRNITSPEIYQFMRFNNDNHRKKNRKKANSKIITRIINQISISRKSVFMSIHWNIKANLSFISNRSNVNVLTYFAVDDVVVVVAAVPLFPLPLDSLGEQKDTNNIFSIFSKCSRRSNRRNPKSRTHTLSYFLASDSYEHDNRKKFETIRPKRTGKKQKTTMLTEIVEFIRQALHRLCIHS